MIIKRRLWLFVFIAITLVAVLVVTQNRKPVLNPDPNHTHADFAVWVDGVQLDFSGEEFMSGSSDESDPNHTKHDPYLHLHDGNGHVIHRHKPGLTLGEFFSTLPWAGKGYIGNTFHLADSPVGDEAYTVRLFVNGTENVQGSEYVFSDGDQILISTTSDDAKIKMEQKLLTDEACKYSKTCPWRGEPPTENCIADPTVPCVVQ